MDANTSAELQHDTPRRDRDAQGFMAEALEDCVERILDGECVPASGRARLDLFGFLDADISLDEQTEWLVRLITRRAPGDTLFDIKHEVERRLREHEESLLRFVA